MRTLLALLTSIGACSAIGDIFKEPDVQLDRVIVRGIGISGGNLAYHDDICVTENGSTTVTLPLKFGWAGVGSAVRAALGFPFTRPGSPDSFGWNHRHSRTISMTRKVPLSDQ